MMITMPILSEPMMMLSDRTNKMGGWEGRLKYESFEASEYIKELQGREMTIDDLNSWNFLGGQATK